MKELLKECRMKWSLFQSIVYCSGMITIFFLLIAFGAKMVNLIEGPVDFQTISHMLMEKQSSCFIDPNAPENQYIDFQIDRIDVGYADEVMKELDKNVVDSVYYLYPLDDVNYISIKVDKEHTEAFDELYYQELEESKTIKHKNISVKGGFIPLRDDLKEYAFDYLSTENKDIKTMDDVNLILSPYVFSIDSIGNHSIMSIYFFMVLIIVIIIGLICFFFYTKYKPPLRKMEKEIEELRDKDEKDAFTQRKQFGHTICCKKFLLIKYRFTYEVIAYSDIAWIYQKKKKQHQYDIYIYYMNASYCKTMVTNEIDANQILDEVFHHNEHVLLGFQQQLYDISKKSKVRFYEYIKSLKPKQEASEEEI